MEELEFIKGFNSGYLIARYNPSISKRIEKLSPIKDFEKGLIDGIKEGNLEIINDRVTDLSNIRTKSKTKDQSKER